MIPPRACRSAAQLAPCCRASDRGDWKVMNLCCFVTMSVVTRGSSNRKRPCWAAAVPLSPVGGAPGPAPWAVSAGAAGQAGGAWAC